MQLDFETNAPSGMSSEHPPRTPVQSPVHVLPAGRVLLWCGWSAIVGLAGCRGCNDDSPYTPYGMASGEQARGAPVSASAPAGSSAPAFATQGALVAPRGATTWQLGPSTISAPPGMVFDRGLVGDLDGDDVPDVVTLVRPTEGVGAEVWVHPPAGSARRIWALPSYVPSGAGCALASDLKQTGKQSVTVDVTATCEARLLERVPQRAVAVLAPLAQDPLVLALRAAAPAPDERLSLAVDSRDRDGDGRDDVLLEVGVSALSASPAVARLAWLVRAAGPSEDASELARSLTSLTTLTKPQKGQGRQVLERVASARRLYASLCAESGTARVFDDDGNAFRCGNLANPMERLARAEVEAWLALDDVLSAVGVLARDGWYHAKLAATTRGELESSIRNRLVPVEPTDVTRLLAPVPAHTGPRWSPLTFEQPEPSLLVRTPAGLIRASADGSREEPADPSGGARVWDLPVALGAGVTWAGVAQACGRSELLAQLAPEGQAAVPLTEVLAARPGTCGGRSVPGAPADVPLGVTDGKLAAIVAGARVGTDPQRAVLGGPRSPDGRHLVVPTVLGLVVLGGDKPELWKVDELAPLETSDCVVANGASAVACVRQTQVILARR